MASNTGITDEYEPDDTCSTARDIVTNDTRETHRFNKVNDEDWVRFTAHAGESFVVTTDQAGPGANPVLTLADSCAGGGNQLMAEVQAAAVTATLSGSTRWTASTTCVHATTTAPSLAQQNLRHTRQVLGMQRRRFRG